MSGLAAKKGITALDVDASQLAVGEKIELEHTDNPSIARQIALDHLAEFPRYYTGLVKLEQQMRKYPQRFAGPPRG